MVSSEEIGALFKEVFESRDPGLRQGVLGTEKEELRQGGKKEREEHRAPQGERADLRTGDRQRLALMRWRALLPLCHADILGDFLNFFKEQS